ncbi:hypothetical protein JHW43_007573 [Diplocarpon mali]|nr:hypothetical protein JHW43_007573 [Diplocarpon mali]
MWLTGFLEFALELQRGVDVSSGGVAVHPQQQGFSIIVNTTYEYTSAHSTRTALLVQLYSQYLARPRTSGDVRLGETKRTQPSDSHFATPLQDSRFPATIRDGDETWLEYSDIVFGTRHMVSQQPMSKGQEPTISSGRLSPYAAGKIKPPRASAAASFSAAASSAGYPMTTHTKDILHSASQRKAPENFGAATGSVPGDPSAHSCRALVEARASAGSESDSVKQM